MSDRGVITIAVLLAAVALMVLASMGHAEPALPPHPTTTTLSPVCVIDGYPVHTDAYHATVTCAVTP